MSTINALVIDNEYSDFSQIKNAFETGFKDSVKVFPAEHNRNDNKLSNWGFLIQTISRNGFSEILEFYPDIDLFVVDNCLKGDQDDTGRRFGAFLKENMKRDFKILYVTNSNSIKEETLQPELEYYLCKYEEEPFLEIALIEKISEMLQINSARKEAQTQAQEQQQDKPQAIPQTQVQPNVPVPVAYKAFKSTKRSITFSATLIDKLFILALFALLVVTILSGAIHIILGFIEPTPAGAAADAHILRLVEHVFLYMIPVFIIYGFFIYYKKNVRNLFIEGFENRREQENDKLSLKTVHMTKTLFMASLISYVMIKAIEELNQAETNVTRVVCMVVLLIIMMAYSLLFDRKE